MLKKISALLLSASLLSAQFVAVCAENTNETPLLSNPEQLTEYCTDRFIVETKTDTNVSIFSTDEATVTDADIENVINDVISDAETISNETTVSDVTLIEEDSSVVTLSENVNANEFMQAVEDTFGDTVIVQPDYPVYMSQATTISAEATITPNPTATPTPNPRADWDKSLSDAMDLSTGEGARIAVLGGYYEEQISYPDYIVDAYNIVGMSPYVSSGTIPSTVSDIHSIAPQAQVIPIGVFGKSYYSPDFDGFAYTSDIVKGIAYARNKGAQVIVGDWRVSQYNAYLESKIEESGILFITSAADGLIYNHIDYREPYPVPDKEYPACFDIENVLTVGSLDDNYNKYCVVPYEDDIDIYAMNYTSECHVTAVSATAGAAALVIGKNNSADNLKNILTNSAATISYLPGTKNAETYKVLDFYDAVMGNTSSKSIKVTTPRSDDNIFYTKHYGWQPSIVYADTEIEQVDGGEFAMASLTKDGKVMLTTIYTDYNNLPSDIYGTIYPALEKHGFPVEVPGLNNISQIALTEDGRGLVALDKNGSVYLYGNKYSLGLSSDTKSHFATPFKCENIENADNIESIYATYQRVWVQKKSNDNQHTETYAITMLDDDITFSKIEAATDAKIYMKKIYNYSSNSKGDVYFIKDGKVYTEKTNDGVITYELDTTISNNKNIVDIYPCKSGIYTLDSNGTMTDPCTSLSTNIPKNIYNVTQMEGAGNAVFYRNTNDKCAKVRLPDTPGSSYIYDYKTKINSDTNIKSVCYLGKGYYPAPASYYDTVFILTEDGTLYYIPAIYNASPSINNNTEREVYMGIAAQSKFEAGNIHSVVPANLNMEYGSATSDLATFLAEKTYNRATITLEDGTDISVPVQWNTSNYDPDKLGKQTFEGNLTLPENITKPETLKAEANVIIRAPINAVETFDTIEVDFDTPLSDIEAKLAEKVKVWTTKPYEKDENGEEHPIELDVVWDTSNYNPNKPTQKFYGSLKIPDELKEKISNPYNHRAMVMVTNPKIEIDDEIIHIDPISMNARKGLLLNIGEKPMVGTEVPTLEDVPETVTAHTNMGETLTLKVTWDDSNYNPFNTSHAQKLTGTVDKPEEYELVSGVEPVLYITALPEHYEVIEILSPETLSSTILGGGSIADVNENITKTVGICAEALSDESMVYFFADIGVTDEDNPDFNPDRLGHQTLVGRFIDDSISTEVYEPAIDVDVNIISSPISLVSTAEITAYQSISIENDENIPDTVNVTLENGMKVMANVEWDFANYHKDAAGDQIITGKLKNLPSGAIQTNPERVATLIIHVTPVKYKIKAVSGDLDATVDACIELEDLKKNLPFDTITVELESVTPNVNITTKYDMPYTIKAEDNEDYDAYYPDIYIITGQFDLPNNITNPNNVLCEICLTEQALEIVSIEPCVANTTKGTAFTDVQKPEKANVTLSNGSVEQIEVNWDSDEGYISESPDLTVDNPIQCTVDGTLTNVPTYINYYNQPVSLNITVTQPKEYYISSISPSRIPETGSLELNLGSTLDDIYKEIKSHIVTLNLKDSNGTLVPSQQVGFTIRLEDNTDYNPTSVDEQTLIAYLDLPENIKNPDGIQLKINVKLVKRVVKSATVVKIKDVPYGTPFNDLGLPENAPVQFTDGTAGELPATWNSTTYKPEKIGSHVVKGTFNTPLPVYAENPNNRQPAAAITIVKENTTILSAEPIETVPQRMMRIAPRNTILDNITEYEDIPGLRIIDYKVTVLNSDGSITEEIMSVFETVE